jgi:outer membrane usher protein
VCRSGARRAALFFAFAPVLALIAGVAPAVAGDDRAPLVTVASGSVPLSLVVNGVDDGISFVLETDGGDVLVPLADLRHACIMLPANALPAGASGATYVHLKGLAPAVTFTVDDDMLVLALTVDPKLLPQTNVALVVPQAAPSANPVTSGFVNYTVTGNAASGSASAASAYVEAGASSSRGAFDTTMSTEGTAIRRGLTSFTTETESRLRRATFGDTVVDAGTLGSDVVLGGFSVERAFDLQPRFLRLPTPGIAGTVLTPTTADVYVNGQFVRSIQLEPGPYDLTALNVQSGANATSIVLHDASGATTTVNATLYLDADLLRKGVTDYDYALGFVRPNPVGTIDRDGPLAVLGRYRVGLSDALSAGARVEADANLFSGGPRVDVGLPVGALSMFAAASDAAGVAGDAFAGAYTYGGRAFNVDVSATHLSRGYATLELAPRQDRRLSEVDERVGTQLGRRTSLTLSNSNVVDRDDGAQRIVQAAVQTNVTRRTSLDLFAERIATSSGPNQPTFVETTPATTGPVAVAPNVAQSGWTFGATLFMQLGNDVDAIVTSQNGTGGASRGLSIERAAPQGPGFGYRLDTSTGDGTTTAYAYVIDRTREGDLTASVQTGASASAQATVAGGLAIFSQGAVFTRPIDGPYALVHVSGIDGAPIVVNDVYAGRTDGRGLLVAPNVAAYAANSVAIGNLQSVPDVREGPSGADVVPKNRTGAIADLTLERVRIFTGTIAIGAIGEPVVPRYGIVDLASGTLAFRSDLGSAGQFYFENVPAGTYEATVQYSGGVCSFALRVPATSVFRTDLGALTCVPS